MKTVIGIIVGIIIAVIGFIAFSLLFPQTAQAPNGGTSTTTTDGTPATGDAVMTSPLPNATITSPVTITGKAKGYYFEASFPIEILDSTGKVIGQGHADAQSDWMTADFVPFTATVTFTAPAKGTTGTIRLKNDNPSGLPENDRHTDFPVKF